MSTTTNSILANNKSISTFYHLLQKFEAGIVLSGPEVKSIRKGDVNLKGSYISIIKNELFLKNAHISPYKQAINQASYDPLQPRKLLLHKSEIIKLDELMSEKGISIHPLNLHLKHGKIKVEIAACKSKKLHDRRDDLKQKAQKLEINRALSRYN